MPMWFRTFLGLTMHSSGRVAMLPEVAYSSDSTVESVRQSGAQWNAQWNEVGRGRDVQSRRVFKQLTTHDVYLDASVEYRGQSQGCKRCQSP